VKQEHSSFQTNPQACIKTVCDESLVAAAKTGEHSAYIELCRRHSTRTLRTVQRITRNFEDAEDAVQESLMKAFAHLGSFDGRSAFSSWLTRIAINSALMKLRKRRNNPEFSLDTPGEYDNSCAFELAETSISPEERVIQHEREHRLHHAVSRLSPNLRGVMEIRQSNDASIEEIAEALGISVAATKSRMLRAKAALRTSLSRRQIQNSPATIASHSK
jgi:RNA polymerase sigma factor (sigma-70 family)